MPVFDLWKDCPGYAEAARREQELRDVPFLGQPEKVSGVDCAPLTLRRVLWLQMVKSPFLLQLDTEILSQKPGIENDIVLFLWIVSPEFDAGNKRARKKFDKRVAKVVLKTKVKTAVSEILEYMEEAWMDAGEGAREKSYYSSAASLTRFFRAQYGLDLDVWENSWLRNLMRKISGKPNALDVPLKIAWQLMRAHSASQSGDVVFSNRISDKAINEHFVKLNQRN